MVSKSSLTGKNNSQKTSCSFFLSIFIIMSLALLPVYAFSSGGFQVVDFPIFIVIAITLLSNYEKDNYVKTVIIYFVPFVIWAFLINMIYFVISGEKWFIIAFVTILYDIFILYCFIRVFTIIVNTNSISLIYIGCFLSVIVSFLVKGQPVEGERAVLSFNDPNQLGYFAAILLGYVILLLKYKEITKYKKPIYYLLDVLLIFIVHYYLLLALSRAAMLAFAFLDLCVIKNIKNMKVIVPLMIFGLVALTFLTIYHPKFIRERLEVRDSSHYSKDDMASGMNSRVIDPIRRMSGIEYLIGKGQGGYMKESSAADIFKRGPRTYGGESHNIFGEVFRGYGLIGLGIFLFWLVKTVLISRRFKDGLWIWAGLLAYNLGNYGIRFRAFWILIAFLIVMAKLHDSQLQMKAAPVSATQPEFP